MNSLVRYDTACRAVSEALSVDEVKEILQESEAMRAYAKQAKNKKMEVEASEIRFRAERRLGQLMAKQKATVGLAKGGAEKGVGRRGNASSEKTRIVPTLAEAGIDPNLANRARKYAAVPDEKFEAILSERRENIEAENKRVTVNLLDEASKVRGTQGTGDNEWFTPAEWLDRAREVLGMIDLDPASNVQAQRTVKAATFYTKDDDGLAHDWCGKIWLNPPYAQPYIEQFADKMISERAAGHVVEAIMLTHNYTDTAWFQKLGAIADAICFTRGRIRFESPEGDLAAPTQGQALFYFGDNIELFSKIFDDAGLVLRRA